jgi:uncharacterized protein (DUF427 family)
MTKRAVWNDQIIAESDDTIVVEGNHYFPPGSVREEFLRPSNTTSVCPWKGTASYYTLAANDTENPDAAWYYPNPLEAASNITGYVAFWRGVTVTD